MIAALTPFRTRSFRYQWPADLCTAWALEMETLILGWCRARTGPRGTFPEAGQ